MKISLIIPTYNRAHLIEETLNSVLNQTYKDWECIVVDDGSNDNTEQVVNDFIAKDARFSFYNRPIDYPKGANACRNFGFEKATGDLINWLDSDDLLVTSHFKVHVKGHKDYDVNCVVSKAMTFQDSPDELISLWSKVSPSGEAWSDMICSRISWATPSVTWKKGVLTTKPFCESLQSSQEWFFHTSMLLKNAQYKIYDKNTIKVRRHDVRIGKSISAQKFSSRFNSRFKIYKQLKKNKMLDRHLEYYLFRVMVNALKKSVYHRYLKNVFKMSFSLLRIGFNSIYLNQLFRITFLGIPCYFVIKKGESLFRFKECV